ncbi:radical SAM family heme chaperone HemW [Persephonella sp.]
MIKGLYVHIPFCSIKCPYCDFVSVTIADKGIYRKYINCLKREIDLYKDLDFQLETVYFGGGTPSVLEPELIGDLLNYIRENFHVIKNPEITVEVNPKTYTVEDFHKVKYYGVNRISIGNQSFLKKNLVLLGRDHNPEDSFKTIESCLKAGIENINLDLIYGIQNQSVEDLEKDLKIYSSLPIKHISAYLLTAYEDTPLGQIVKKGKYTLPDEETTLEMFKLIDSFLEKEGFKRYELSNWAKEGYQCKHNLFYWTHIPFLGIGVSAWSFVNMERFGNTKNIYEYMKKLDKGEKPVFFREKLDENEIKKEKIFLGLRLKEGVLIDLVKDRMEIVKNFVADNYARIENGRLSLTPKGLMVSNYIASMLI